MSETAAAEGLKVAGATAKAVFTPGSLDEIRDALRQAAASGLTLVPAGGRTQLELGNAPVGPFALLDLSKALQGPVEHEPTDMTAVVPAGVTLEEVAGVLAHSGQWLPLDPPLPGAATVGGVVAVGTNGSLRTRYGLPRDMVLGMTVMRADGTLVKAGGRVVKNVTGYDLMRLWTGSLGTLGVITEVALRVLPRQDTSWLHFRADSFGPIFDAGLALMAADVRAEIFDARLEGGSWRVLARVPAAAAHAARQAARLDVSDGDGEAEYALHRDLGTHESDSLTVRLNTTPRGLMDAVAAVSALRPEALVAMPLAGTMRATWDERSQAGLPKLAEGLGEVRKAVTATGGSLVFERMPPTWRTAVDAWGPAPASVELMRKTKQSFDPQGILNGGRYAGGI